MANFEKLAKKEEPSTRKEMFKQMKDLGVEPETKEDKKKKQEQADKEGPGSKAYNDRRERDYERDLKENPRK